MVSLIAISFRTMSVEEMQWRMVLTFILYNSFYCFICWVSHSWLLTRQSSIHQNSLWFMLLSIIGVAFLVFMAEWALSFMEDSLFPFIQDIEGTKKYVIMAMRKTMLSGLYYFILRHMYLLNEKQMQMKEIAQLKQAHLEVKLSSLQEQLSPHFLFNTLNTLSSLTDQQNVKEFVAELANCYRYVLSHKKQEAVSLKEELEFTASYLYIIKSRMEDAIDIVVRVGDELKDTLVAPFTIQLLIENAVKHNIASITRPLEVDVFTEGGQYIVVSNKLQPKITLPQSTGIGLSNIMQRYQLLFKNDIIIEKSEVSFIVKLPIVQS